MEEFVFTFLFHGFEVLVQPRRSFFPAINYHFSFASSAFVTTQKTQKSLGVGMLLPNSWG